jgi:hypothetical protein
MQHGLTLGVLILGFDKCNQVHSEEIHLLLKVMHYNM